MGFMGYSVNMSDMASDFVYVCVGNIEKAMKKEINQDHGGYNTPGVVNIALLFDEFIWPIKHFFKNNEEILRMAVYASESLGDMAAKGKESAHWIDEEEKKYFIDNMKRLKRRIDAYIRFVNKND